MFKQAFRLTFITFVWKRYKRAIVSSILLIAYLWFVGFAHAEYLHFVELQQQQQNIGFSFFIKWLAMLVGVIAYLLFFLLSKKDKRPHKQAASSTPLSAAETEQDDPFDQIRNKDKLRSRADIIIEQNKRR